MVDHQGDVTQAEYPERENLPTSAPRDTGEVFDTVVRKGPLSLDAMMNQIHFMSQDDVFSALQALKKKGYVDRVEGDLEEHGTTRDVWFVPESSE